MKNRRTSIKDIAAVLNISVTTVSFVLNGKAKEMKISDEVIKRVQTYTQKVNYTPNRLAQGLRTGKSKVIVFMVEDISNPFFAKLARIIEDLANDKGYRLLFCSNDNEDRKSRELINLFMERQVDGFIITPSAGIKETIRELIEAQVPVVLFDRYFRDLKTNFVIIDNEEAAYRATKHLLENDFKNIGFITTDVEQTQMADRLNGYKSAVRDFLVEEKFLKLSFKQKPHIRQEELKFFLEANPQLDSLFFATNYLIQDGLMVLREQFPRMITDCGLMAFDDDPLFAFSTPAISAVRQPLEEIGQKLMYVLLRLLEADVKKEELQQIILPAELEIRESSIAKNSLVCVQTASVQVSNNKKDAGSQSW